MNEYLVVKCLGDCSVGMADRLLLDDQRISQPFRPSPYTIHYALSRVDYGSRVTRPA